MNKIFSSRLLSSQMQLNIAGAALLVVLGFSAWNLAHPFTWLSVVPLLCIAYAAFRIIFELTWNRKNVPTLAMSWVGRRKVVQVLKQDAERRGKKNYRIIDLGSGRGQLARYMGRRMPQAEIIGIEIARIPYLQSAFVQRWLGPGNLSYQCLDFWLYDCADIDAVVFYLNPSFAQRVGEKLQRELKPGSVVISHTFPLLGDWAPLEVLTFRTPFKETLYVYRKE